MGSIYQASYTADAVKNARTPIVIAAGQKVCTAVQFPVEGYILGLVIRQSSGTSVAYTADLLNSNLPYPAGTYASGASPAVTIDPYRIQSPDASLTALSGAVMTLATQNFGYSYRNLDSDPSTEYGYIYLLITPTAAGGSTTWEAFIKGRYEKRA